MKLTLRSAHRALAISMFAAGATLLLPATSVAGTIEVQERTAPPGRLYNEAELYFHDDGSEQNALSIALTARTIVGTGRTFAEFYTMEVIDSASPLTAGGGCNGGGLAGTPVTCTVHAFQGPLEESCGRGCRKSI